MAQVRLVDTDLVVVGDLSASTMSLPSGSVSNATVASSANIERTKLATETSVAYPVPLTSFRVHDAMQTLLPNPSANDDLGMYGGTLATNAPRLMTADLKTAGATTVYARVQIPLPPEYVEGSNVTLRISAGMVGATADNTATIDVQAYEADRVGGVSADLCTTAATSINSLTFADKDFTITGSGLAVNSVLDVRIAVAVNDAAGAGSVQAAIGQVELLCNIKG